ncbi:hypothetical protein AQI95_43125 [Streptomyces yokosukanensis]|uniref:PASTA domain-containing protein n=2 Tax=Streptomyces yokosukanensis TaxID=67386 RepID=A0A117PWR0_9ACTN|nr:hypothetical protein [Streptomyces yokosukanensis]KUM95453.1 hypothetical protein AQI95_43125 [Streptomyces yokosukanensis]
MTSYGDARPSGRSPFEEELMNAMNQYANSAEAPDFDAPRIVRRTRRRRAVGIAAVATVIVLGGGGTALAAMNGGGSQSAAATKTPSAKTPAAYRDATTLLYAVDGEKPIPADLWGWDLNSAKAYLLKTQTKLGTVSKGTAPKCKPDSVIEVSPHAPKTVANGDTVSFVLCAGN